MIRFASAMGLLCLAAVTACGGGVESPRAELADGSTENVPTVDSGHPTDAHDAAFSDASRVPDATPQGPVPDGGKSDLCPYPNTYNPGWARCNGSTYTSSPSGNACDPSRIWLVHASGCEGATVGTYCDFFEIVIALADQPKLQRGWVCEDAGVSSTLRCHWPLSGDTPGALYGSIDDAALDAACAVTALGTACPYVVSCGVLE
jgi:hypothetical protein